MPTRKQRRRAQKGRRHEYETVWVDAEGNELEEPPEDELVSTPEKRTNGAKPKAKPAQQRGGRSVRVPPAPSWQRAFKRSAILGVVIFVLFYMLGSKNGGHNIGGALALAAVYTALFIPFTYVIDRFSHNRWQRRAEQQGQKGQQARKR
ncbi:MAG TPA: hypothetical protein VFM43_06540 [Gaiellaceae bacterium]|nr:hypothetical protein [Gaiellaceae bacterium]